MEKIYKQTRLIAFIFLGVIIISHLIDIPSIGSAVTLSSLKGYDCEEWSLSYSWLGGIIGLAELAIYTWFFLMLVKVLEYKTAAILAFVGIGMVLVNNLAYASQYFFTGEGYTWETHMTITKVRVFACLYPARIVFATALLMVARKYPRLSMVYMGGVIYMVYTIVSVMYGLIMSLFGMKLVTANYPFWYSTVFIVLAILAELALFAFFFDFSKGKQIEGTDATVKQEEGTNAPEETIEINGDTKSKKKTFFLKRWLVGLSNVVDRWLFGISQDSDEGVGGLFWLLFVIGFVIGGVTMAVSFLGDAIGASGSEMNFFEKLIIIAGVLFIGLLTIYIIRKTSNIDSGMKRFWRGLFIAVWCVIGLALGILLGLIVVAAVILLFVTWLLLKLIWTAALGNDGDGKKRKWKLEDGTEVTEEKGLLGDKSYKGNDGHYYEKVDDLTFRR